MEESAALRGDLTHARAQALKKPLNPPSCAKSTKRLGLLRRWLHIHCYGDGARIPSKEAEMIYREVHPSRMAMREAQPPNNTGAWRTSGPFNSKEIVPRGPLRGHLSHHQVMRGSRSPSIVGVLGDTLHRRALPLETFEREEEMATIKPSRRCWCKHGWLLHLGVSVGIFFNGAWGLASNIFYSILLVGWEASDSGGGEECDLSLTLLDESALGG